MSEASGFVVTERYDSKEEAARRLPDEEKRFPFEPGEIVQLNSGGPIMTVDYVYDATCTCSWFDTTWHRQEGDFRHATLRARPDATLCLAPNPRPPEPAPGRVRARATLRGCASA